MVYTQIAPDADVVYVETGSGTDVGDVLATGAIVLGAAMILDEILDNDDPWDDYWRGPPRVDWSNNDLQARPNLHVDRDITNIDRTRMGSSDREAVDRNFRPDDAQRAAARGKFSARKAGGGAVALLPATTRPMADGAQARVADAKASGKLKPATANRPVAASHPAAAKHKADGPRAAHVSRSEGASRPAANRAVAKGTTF